jgi:HAD superfamily hydrolase (TIGR01509 family)
MTLRALIWDVDGTLAETERDGHRLAFNQAFAAAGLSWHWSERRYGELLAVSGGHERLLHDMASRADAPATPAARDALARQLHRRKNAIYGALVARGAIALRTGVLRLIDEARHAGARHAIATTTSRANVQALLSRHLGTQWSDAFAAIVCADDAPLKKPHPMAYAIAIERLGLAPHDALAIEDSPNGLAAAQAAGMPVLVTRSAYFASFDTRHALAVAADLDAPPTPAAPLPAMPAAPRVDWRWLCAAHAAWRRAQAGVDSRPQSAY